MYDYCFTLLLYSTALLCCFTHTAALLTALRAALLLYWLYLYLIPAIGRRAWPLVVVAVFSCQPQSFDGLEGFEAVQHSLQHLVAFSIRQHTSAYVEGFEAVQHTLQHRLALRDALLAALLGGTPAQHALRPPVYVFITPLSLLLFVLLYLLYLLALLVGFTCWFTCCFS